MGREMWRNERPCLPSTSFTAKRPYSTAARPEKSTGAGIVRSLELLEEDRWRKNTIPNDNQEKFARAEMNSSNRSNSSSSRSNGTTEEVSCLLEGQQDYFTSFCVCVLVAIFLTKLVHTGFRRIGQPRIISEFAVGCVIGILPYLKEAVGVQLENGFRVMESFSSGLYMFVLGLEMEPMAILRPPGPEAKIAYAGIISTITIFSVIGFVFRDTQTIKIQLHGSTFTYVRIRMAFAVMYAATSSPIITRLITDLKLGQSDIGRRAIRAGMANDMVCTILMGMVVATRGGPRSLFMISICVAAEMAIVVYGMRPVFRWANRRNPEGKAVKGLDMTLLLLATQGLCHLAKLFNYDSKINAFLIGLALPRHGRVSNFLISKINYVLMTFILPIYVAVAGIRVGTTSTEAHIVRKCMVKMPVATIIAFCAKVVGTLAASLLYGLHWMEAGTLGVILNIKGYFQIFFAMHAMIRKMMTEEEFTVLVGTVLMSIIYVQPLMILGVRKARRMRGGGPRLMGLQWSNPANQLRITMGLHGPQNVLASMTLIEMLRIGSDVGTVVYVMDMVELNEQSRAALVYREDTNQVTVADSEVIELRNQIGAALDAHLEASGREEITLSRSLAISSFADMHDDICSSAQDNLSVLIVLPFHKSQQPDGTMDDGHAGFRTVNQNVLQNAPCSIGILVDRGLGGSDNRSASEVSMMNVVTVFIGGADDREALACAGIIAQHPAIRLMVFRLIQDTEAIAADGPGRRIFAAMPQRAMEMQVDDQYFAGFYEHYITNGSVGYMEKQVKNGAEAVKILREMEGEYQLLIVGQGNERNSLLTAGLSEWAEFPELGPIGDILASSDFPLTASVLIIQQHNPARDSKYISDEFMPL